MITLQIAQVLCMFYLKSCNKFISKFSDYILRIYLHDFGFDKSFHIFRIVALEYYGFQFVIVKIHVIHCVLTVLAINFAGNTYFSTTLISMLP